MRVRMINSRTIAGDGSSTTLLASNFYLLGDDLAEQLVTDGDAEFESAAPPAITTEED